jgi:hypothetical protein
MQRTDVSSKLIRSIGYDAALQLLELEFASGKVYQYLEVPESAHTDLLNAPSIGTFFNSAVRDTFSHRRVQ